MCDRPSGSLEGSCPDHKACKDACIAEPDSRIIGGICQATTSVSESAVEECVKNVMSQIFGRAIADKRDCSSLEATNRDVRRDCERGVKSVQEKCRTENTVNTGDRCTCSYLC